MNGDSPRETDRAESVSLVSSDVVAVSFRYFDGHDWTDRWDGYRLRKLPRCVEVTARFAEARLGNWNRQKRVLSGRLDDFVVLSRVMPADEMLAFFEATKPY